MTDALVTELQLCHNEYERRRELLKRRGASEESLARFEAAVRARIIAERVLQTALGVA